MDITAKNFTAPTDVEKKFTESKVCLESHPDLKTQFKDNDRIYIANDVLDKLEEVSTTKTPMMELIHDIFIHLRKSFVDCFAHKIEKRLFITDKGVFFNAPIIVETRYRLKDPVTGKNTTDIHGNKFADSAHKYNQVFKCVIAVYENRKCMFISFPEADDDVSFT